MTSSIDTNILIDFWDVLPEINVPMRQLLDRASSGGKLVVIGCVYAELLAGPGRTVNDLDDFFRTTNILVDWAIEERIWKRAGNAYHGYITRRHTRKAPAPEKAPAPRGILTDFLIGAHAEIHGHTLLTRDRRLYRAAFPNLRIQNP